MSDSSAERVADDLRRWIADARPGDQLPPTRALVQRFSVSPGTVQKALRSLTSAGLVETRIGVGAFVRPRAVTTLADYRWQTSTMGAQRANRGTLSSTLRAFAPDAIALHSGYPDRQLVPTRLIASAFSRAARGSSTLTRPPTSGIPELQEWFAAELGRWVPSDLTPPTARDVLILPGSQSGLSGIFRALAGAGQSVLVESPTYWGAIMAAEQAGVRLIPVASGPTGPDPDEIDQAFQRHGARVFYAQPNFANPTGVQWDSVTAQRILDIVRENRAFLVEDDWAHDFAMTGATAPIGGDDADGHVIYLRSLTKSISPAVRVAGVIARGPAHERLVADAQAQTMYVSSFLQAVALDVVTHSGWRSHLRQLREQLTQRRDHLSRAVENLAPRAIVESQPRGGLNLWVRLPSGTDVPRLVADCEKRKVIVAAGDEWFPAEPTGPYLRLNFAGPNPERFDEGADGIGKALAEQFSAP